MMLSELKSYMDNALKEAGVEDMEVMAVSSEADFHLKEPALLKAGEVYDQPVFAIKIFDILAD